MPGSKEAPERDGGGAGGTHHVGAVFDGLLGVKGAVLPGDALADHAGALVDEHRRRRSGGRGCGEAPRVEEARGGGPQQVRRAARGGHGAVLQAAALFPPFPTRFDLLQFFFLRCLHFPFFLLGLLDPFLQGKSCHTTHTSY
jgi:hypothetical protein